MSPVSAPDTVPATRWLSADELDAWISLMGLLHRLPAALNAQLRRDSALTHFDYGVMAMLSERPDHTSTMTELARFWSCSLSRLSHSVARLEVQGWIRRSELPTDRRVTMATLTAAGHAILTAAAPGHVAEARRLVVDALDAHQVECLRDVARAILQRVDCEGGAVPAPSGGCA